MSTNISRGSAEEGELQVNDVEEGECEADAGRRKSKLPARGGTKAAQRYPDVAARRAARDAEMVPMCSGRSAASSPESIHAPFDESAPSQAADGLLTPSASPNGAMQTAVEDFSSPKSFSDIVSVLPDSPLPAINVQGSSEIVPPYLAAIIPPSPDDWTARRIPNTSASSDDRGRAGKDRALEGAN